MSIVEKDIDSLKNLVPINEGEKKMLVPVIRDLETLKKVILADIGFDPMQGDVMVYIDKTGNMKPYYTKQCNNKIANLQHISTKLQVLESSHVFPYYAMILCTATSPKGNTAEDIGTCDSNEAGRKFKPFAQIVAMAVTRARDRVINAVAHLSNCSWEEFAENDEIKKDAVDIKTLPKTTQSIEKKSIPRSDVVKTPEQKPPVQEIMSKTITDAKVASQSTVETLRQIATEDTEEQPPEDLETSEPPVEIPLRQKYFNWIQSLETSEDKQLGKVRGQLGAKTPSGKAINITLTDWNVTTSVPLSVTQAIPDDQDHFWIGLWFLAKEDCIKKIIGE